MRGEGLGEARTPSNGTEHREVPRSIRSEGDGVMQSRRGTRNQATATRARHVSLDLSERQDALDMRLIQVLERIERVQSIALEAAETLLAGRRNARQQYRTTTQI